MYRQLLMLTRSIAKRPSLAGVLLLEHVQTWVAIVVASSPSVNSKIEIETLFVSSPQQCGVSAFTINTLKRQYRFTFQLPTPSTLLVLSLSMPRTWVGGMHSHLVEVNAAWKRLVRLLLVHLLVHDASSQNVMGSNTAALS
jgi:hypothetical protein